MLEQKRLGHNGPSAAGTNEFGDRGDEMNKQDDQVAHPGIVAIGTNAARLGYLQDPCDKFEVRHRQAALGSYAVLSFFKVIEVRYPRANKVKAWIAKSFDAVTSDASSDPEFKHFMASLGGEAPEEYLNDACRVAVAHASEDHPSDADEADEATRLYTAAHVLRLLARHFIASELGVSDEVYSGT